MSTAKAHYLRNHTSGDLLSLPFPDLIALEAKPGDPRHPQQFPTKAEFTAWHQNPDTDHAYFSGWEPTDPGLRLTKTNPAAWLHAIVADYDVQNLEQSAVERAIEDAQKTGFPVSYASRTYSGGLRLVWVLEKPVAIFNEQVAAGFLKRVQKELKLTKLAPGLDVPAFLDPAKIYELGTRWVTGDKRGLNEAPRTLPSTYTEAWAFEASDKANWEKEGGLAIPIEVLAAEVKKQFPGRWEGPFEVGSQGPRFWVPGADAPKGAWVRETGVQDFVEGKFLHWDVVLGKAFVAAYEADRISAAVEGAYCELTKYWKKNEKGFWKENSADQMRRHFRFCGLTDEKRGDSQSEVERALYYLETQRRVDAVGAFLYVNRDIVEREGRLYLNKSHTRVLQPANGVHHWGDRFPWCASLIDGLFTEPQRSIFLGWLAHAYQGALRHKAVQGHALFIVGPTGTGKTLLSHEIVSGLLGSRGEATSYLLGRDNFNAELIDKAVWTVDDAEIATDRQAHSQWSERVKKAVANRDQIARGMYREGATVPWLGRIVVTLNDDAIAMLPNVDANLLEKVMFFLVKDPGVLFQGCAEKIACELPNLGAYVRDLVIPETLKDPRNSRFGLSAFHHEVLLKAAKDDTPTADIDYIVQEWRKQYFAFHSDKLDWEGAPHDLFTELYQTDSLAQLLRHTIKTPAYLGRGLTTLIRQGTKWLSKRKSGTQLYRIERPEGVKVGTSPAAGTQDALVQRAGVPGTEGGWAEGQKLDVEILESSLT